MMKIPFENFQHPDSIARWEKTQQPIYEQIIKSDKKAIMLSAPTGLGKSLICAMAGKKLANTINYVCSDKSLQDQLLNDFPEAEVLKGRGNYKCDAFPEYNADSCDGKCDDYKEGAINCEYYDQKQKVLEADFRILNTHYLLFEMNYAGQFSRQDLIIVDEADTLDMIFIDFVSLNISARQNKRYGLGMPKVTKIESWIPWAGEAINHIKRNHTLERYEGKYLFKYPKAPELIKAQQLQKKIEMFVRLVQDDWICNNNAKYAEFKPVWITKELIREFLLRHSARFIFCSASLPPKEIICDTLQIPIKHVDYIEVGSSFKPENRKVYYEPIMDMSYKNREKYGKMVDACIDVMNKYPNDKGIIHGQSYALCQQIMDTNNPRLITHDSYNKAEKLRIFMNSGKPLVFVSPSCVRGLSLKDDMARFGICPKMPFPNIKDKAISQRLYGSGTKGKKWYNAETGQSVLQQSGRHVRSHTDYGDMWILDSCFNRVKKTLPAWYVDEIIQDFDY